MTVTTSNDPARLKAQAEAQRVNLFSLSRRQMEAFFVGHGEKARPADYGPIIGACWISAP